jgi:hypothetical protein
MTEEDEGVNGVVVVEQQVVLQSVNRLGVGLAGVGFGVLPQRRVRALVEHHGLLPAAMSHARLLEPGRHHLN